MHTITIDGNKVSTYDAVIWASRHFGHSFNVQHEFPGWHWRFSFQQPEQATLFALKWAN